MMTTVISNFIVLAGAWCLFTIFGFLLFRKILARQSAMVRGNLYPLLGWASLVPFSYALRVIALPFAITGPIALSILLVVLLVRNRDLFTHRPLLRRPETGQLIMIGVLVANLIPYSALHLTYKNLRDVGNWGYDQRNYIFTSAGLLEEGLLGATEGTAPAKWITPYGAYVEDSVRQIATNPKELDWFYTGLHQRLGIEHTGTRMFAVFPRRGFSSLSALVASVLRVDPQQAYTLSIWMQHVLLTHVALLAAALLGLRWGGYVLSVLLVSYWPASCLAAWVDNRDQANSVVLFFLTILVLRFLPRSTPISMACLLALWAGYPELSLPGVAVFLALYLEREGGLWRNLRQAGVDLGWTLLVFGPLFIPQLMGIMHQWNPKGDNFVLAFPPQYAFKGALWDIGVGWGLIWGETMQLRWRVGVDLMVLFLAGIALVADFRQRKYGLAAAFAALMGLALVLYFKSSPYTAYKVSSAIWPVTCLLVLKALTHLSSPPPLIAGRQLPSWLRFTPYAAAALLLLAASVPPFLYKAGINLPGAWAYNGANAGLQEPEQLTANAWPPRERKNDLNELERIRQETIKKKEGVLILGTNVNYMPHDFGFAQMLFRHDGAYILFPRDKDWQPAYPGLKRLKAGTAVKRVILQDTPFTVSNHRSSSHIFLTHSEIPKWKHYRTIGEIRLPEAESAILLTPSLDENTLMQIRKAKKPLLPLALPQNSLNLWAVPLNQKPGEEARLEFVLEAPQMTTADFVVKLSRNKGEPTPLSLERQGNQVRFQVALAPGTLEETLNFKFKPVPEGLTLKEVHWLDAMPGTAGN